jgi:hypothetical protein
MTRKPAPKVFIVGELNDLLQKLDTSHKFHKWLSDMKAVLKENIYAGELVRKSQIPKHYFEKFGVNHLYRYNHPEGHRSCYSIVEGCPRIFDIMTHSEYDNRFGYQTT